MTSSTKSMAAAKGSDHQQLIKRVTWVIALGVILNPLNSSMISVALLNIGAEFGISIATVTWLISSFYLAATVGQPLMGKLADLFGPRRVFSIGMALVIVSSILSVWAPSFGWLLVLRIVQAFGTTGAFPAGLSILRSITRTAGDSEGKSSTSSLGLISIAANVMAAFGPTLGGLLVAYSGWQSIFWINIPVALLVLLLVFKWVPADSKNPPSDERKSVLHLIDLPGIILFSGMFTSLVLFLVSLGKGTQWWLLIIVPIAAALLILRELRTDKPFLDVRMLASNIRLTSVFAQYAGLNMVFYSLFFGLPLWLGQVRGYDPQMVGLLMLPFAGIGVLTTPLAVRMIGRSGYRQPIILGSIVLVIGTLLLLLLGPHTPVAIILLVFAVIGISNGMNNMGLSTAMYSNTKPEDTGVASGLFQTFRSVGSIFSTSLLGLIFSGSVTTSGLHIIAIVAAVISAGLLAVGCSRKLT
ncbi:drug resistance transporter, EmrB/QacA subfamily [Paenibacillus tianmuensis]|uniref:Drug resistance transporter, EmrB/QacA subfamily n=2 Tax=Paenibacillus tianmuensis TaxID=624147 RepID=A0A1G4TRC6_9BACL|nr:drug resistance transporter, EmrB/QacA subfamily [Paenibacillus tianmuensis]